MYGEKINSQGLNWSRNPPWPMALNTDLVEYNGCYDIMMDYI